jgi:hypothetical protein
VALFTIIVVALNPKSQFVVALSAFGTISPVLKLNKVNFPVVPVGYPVSGLKPVPGSAGRLVTVVAITESADGSSSEQLTHASAQTNIIERKKTDLIILIVLSVKFKNY